MSWLVYFLDSIPSNSTKSLADMLGSGVARGLLQGRLLPLPMGWGVGEELTKSWPTFEQLCVQILLGRFRAVFFIPRGVQNPAG